jgi:uncharacterized SAM-binding protein YcdF (DUF218 family)
MAGKIAPDAGIIHHLTDNGGLAMPLSLFIKKILSALALPPLMPLVCIAAGLLLAKRRPRLGRGLAWCGLALIWLTSTPAVLDLLARPLEDVPVLEERDLARGEAIVILGAGIRRLALEYGGAPAPNRLALERLRFGAKLARDSRLPVLVSGGAPLGVVAEAPAMAQSLREDFGIAPRWVEDASLDTADNARFSAALLKQAGIRRVVLVTHAAHMRRSVGEFAAQGLEVIPAPTGHLVDHSPGVESFRLEDVFDCLPSASAAFASWFVIHEWAGILAQKIRLTLATEASAALDTAK